MGTLTADVPQLEEHCSHKLASSCRLTSTFNCCACADDRIHSPTYRKYIDGVGYVQCGVRWDHYCWPCYSFWNARIEASGIEPRQTRIPDHPNQAAFTKRWLEFHQGYRIVHTPDGREERIAVSGEMLKNVDPGVMPRTLDELRAGRLTGEEVAPEILDISAQEETEVGPSLDEALDQLLDDALAEEGQEQQDMNTATATSTAAQPDPTTPSTAMELQALRQEIENGRREIESQERLLQDHQRQLDVEEQDLADSEERIEEYRQGMAALRRRISHHQRFLSNEQQHSATIEERIASRTADMRQTMVQLQALRQQLRQNRRRGAAEGNFARVFGTREDIQSDEYVSPITNMFMRVNEWGRRQQSQPTPPSAQSESPSQMEETIEPPPNMWAIFAAERRRRLGLTREEIAAEEEAPFYNWLSELLPELQDSIPARRPSEMIFMTTRGPIRNGEPLSPSETEEFYSDSSDYILAETMMPFGVARRGGLGRLGLDENSLPRDRSTGEASESDEVFRDRLDRQQRIYEALCRSPRPSPPTGRHLSRTSMGFISDDENEADRVYGDHLERRLHARFPFDDEEEDEVDFGSMHRSASLSGLVAFRPPSTRPAQVARRLLDSTVQDLRQRNRRVVQEIATVPRRIGLDIGDKRPKAKSDEEMMMKVECKICMSQLADTACLPCGHLSMCSWCADQAVPVKKEDKTRPAKKGVKCPVCRDTVKSRVKIFVA